MGLQNKSRLLALSVNIRVGWKIQEVTNNLAYFDTKLITAVKNL
jgi:hypothetical protein